MSQIKMPRAVFHHQAAQQGYPQALKISQSYQKVSIYTKKLNSKKPAGAFKLFRERKSRKDKNQQPLQQELKENQQTLIQRTFKLKIRTPKTTCIQSNEEWRVHKQALFGYYDPNLAKLLTEASRDSTAEVHGRGGGEQKSVHAASNELKIIVQNKLQKNIQIQQPPPRMYFDADITLEQKPFIILKKEDIKKNKINKKLEQLKELHNPISKQLRNYPNSEPVFTIQIKNEESPNSKNTCDSKSIDQGNNNNLSKLMNEEEINDKKRPRSLMTEAFQLENRTHNTLFEGIDNHLTGLNSKRAPEILP